MGKSLMKKGNKEKILTKFATAIGWRAVEIGDNSNCKHCNDYNIFGGSDEVGEWSGLQICDKCGEKFNPDHLKRKYNTPSGFLEVGNLYWNTWEDKNQYWDNQFTDHLMCVLPNGSHWNIDSRASNCTMKEDRKHRCWVRHGEPETSPVNVDKRGHTCKAGQGSIKMGDYHGFLRNGYLQI